MPAVFVKNPAQVVTALPDVVRGADGAAPEPQVLTGVSVLCEGATIAAVGPTAELEPRARELDARTVDATGRAVIPGFVDCHSHLVFAGNRADEFSRRCSGESYESIAASGGGIPMTVEATRRASEDELLELARTRLDTALAHGTTTMEVKSGYGLDLETELKMLRVVGRLNAEHPVDLVPTFLGAHAVPSGTDRAEYFRTLLDMLPRAAELARFCDVFCEQGYFSPKESAELLVAAAEHGMLPKMHANQFHSIGCLQTAKECGCVSVDHLEVLEPDEIRLLAESDMACVLLPGVSLFLGIPYAPGRALLDAGAVVALGSDFNPGSNMSSNMQLVMTLACLRMGLSAGEALCCATAHSARALRLDGVGCIAEGRAADLLLLDGPDYAQVAYEYGRNHVAAVIKGGRPV